MKCDSCIFSRTIVSENGFHSVCCLSDEKALECLKSGKHYVVHPNCRSKNEEMQEVANRDAFYGESLND